MTTQNSHSSNYFEPEKPPEEVLVDGKRQIKLRFKTKEDVLEFYKKTGIELPHKKNVFLNFPLPTNSLEEFY